MTRLADEIRGDLEAAGNPDRAVAEQAYLKSELRHLGTSVPATRSVAEAARRAHPDLTHDQVVELVELLWAEPVHECRAVCGELLVAYHDRLGPDDIARLERLLRGSRTWALVDGLAANVVGRLVEAHHELTDVLDRWAADPDFWIRRSALLALLVPLREGRGDFARFGRYADAMLDEREFFIRKAIGWVLRDTGRRRPDLVFEWLLPRAARLSSVTLREALKPLSPAQRARISAARG